MPYVVYNSFMHRLLKCLKESRSMTGRNLKKGILKTYPNAGWRKSKLFRKSIIVGIYRGFFSETYDRKLDDYVYTITEIGEDALKNAKKNKILE